MEVKEEKFLEPRLKSLCNETSKTAAKMLMNFETSENVRKLPSQFEKVFNYEDSERGELL